MKEEYKLIIKGEAFKRLIITRSTVTLVNGKEQKNTIEIYNEPVNTYDLIKLVESVINSRIVPGEFSISKLDVKKFIS